MIPELQKHMVPHTFEFISILRVDKVKKKKVTALSSEENMNSASISVSFLQFVFFFCTSVPDGVHHGECDCKMETDGKDFQENT